jgi:hypothetical protein
MGYHIDMHSDFGLFGIWILCILCGHFGLRSINAYHIRVDDEYDDIGLVGLMLSGAKPGKGRAAQDSKTQN